MKQRRTPAASPLPIWAGGIGALALCFLILPLAFMLGRVDWGSLGSTLSTDEATSALALSLRTCLIALVSASAKKDLGQKWIDLVLSADGQKILEDAGFTPAAK